MPRIDTTSGLHGDLIEFIATDGEGFEGLALVKRQDPPVESRPYSTHRVYTLETGSMVAEAGHYDLTLDQGRLDLAARAGRI